MSWWILFLFVWTAFCSLWWEKFCLAMNEGDDGLTDDEREAWGRYCEQLESQGLRYKEGQWRKSVQTFKLH